MFKTVVVVNVVAGGEPVIVDVDCVVGSRVADDEPKVSIDINVKLWYELTMFKRYSLNLFYHIINF